VAFGTSDAGVGRARFADFVAAGLHDAFANPLLHGSTLLASRVAPDLERHETTCDYVYAARFAARPSLGSLLDGCPDRPSVEDACHAAFNRYGYTLAAIAAMVNRHPSVISRWVLRAKARQPADRVGPSPVGDVVARNKI
jgi:hypothetical protein